MSHLVFIGLGVTCVVFRINNQHSGPEVQQDARRREHFRPRASRSTSSAHSSRLWWTVRKEWSSTRNRGRAFSRTAGRRRPKSWTSAARSTAPTSPSGSVSGPENFPDRTGTGFPGASSIPGKVPSGSVPSNAGPWKRTEKPGRRFFLHPIKNASMNEKWKLMNENEKVT